MQSFHPLRDPRTPPRTCSLLLLSFALGAFSTQLAAQLPASTSTRPSAAVPSPQPATSFANSAPPQQQPATPHAQHHARITFTDSLLSVSASNASLNGLIREIARQTGMKVTGSVAEDRVFGEYGPGDPQSILATLLDGTGSNILIRSAANDAPLELILTPRTGAASPPSPNLSADNEDTDDQAPPGAPTSSAAPRSRVAVLPGSVPQPPPPPDSSNAIPPASETVVFPPVDATSAPVTATTTPSDSNEPADTSADTVKTPQQIFEQLQKLRQQNTPGPNAPQ